MKIIVDGFGGDNAPLAVLEGCRMAADEYGVEIILTGDEKSCVRVQRNTVYLLQEWNWYIRRLLFR